MEVDSKPVPEGVPVDLDASVVLAADPSRKSKKPRDRPEGIPVDLDASVLAADPSRKSKKPRTRGLLKKLQNQVHQQFLKL